VERSIGYKFWGIFFNRCVQGRDSYRLDPAISIQEQNYPVYRTLPVFKSGTVFADCLKCHFLIPFSEDMVGFYDFHFVRSSFLGVRLPKNIKNSGIKLSGLVPYSQGTFGIQKLVRRIRILILFLSLTIKIPKCPKFCQYFQHWVTIGDAI